MLDFLSKKYKLTEEVSLMFTDIGNALQHSKNLDKGITAFINTRYDSQTTIREFSRSIPFPVFTITRNVDETRPCSFFECSFLLQTIRSAKEELEYYIHFINYHKWNKVALLTDFRIILCRIRSDNLVNVLRKAFDLGLFGEGWAWLLMGDFLSYRNVIEDYKRELQGLLGFTQYSLDSSDRRRKFNQIYPYLINSTELCFDLTYKCFLQMGVAELLNILIRSLSNNQLIKYRNTNKFRMKFVEEVSKIGKIELDSNTQKYRMTITDFLRFPGNAKSVSSNQGRLIEELRNSVIKIGFVQMKKKFKFDTKFTLYQYFGQVDLYGRWTGYQGGVDTGEIDIGAANAIITRKSNNIREIKPFTLHYYAILIPSNCCKLARAIMTMWYISVFLFQGLYIAAIVTQFSLESSRGDEKLINTIERLIEHKHLNICWHTNSVVTELMRESYPNRTAFIRLLEKIEQTSGNRSLTECAELVANSFDTEPTVLMITDYEEAMEIRRKYTCSEMNIIELKGFILLAGLPYSASFKYADIFTQEMNKMKRDGIYKMYEPREACPAQIRLNYSVSIGLTAIRHFLTLAVLTVFLLPLIGGILKVFYNAYILKWRLSSTDLKRLNFFYIVKIISSVKLLQGLYTLTHGRLSKMIERRLQEKNGILNFLLRVALFNQENEINPSDAVKLNPLPL
ncbi:DgyrCDS3593 [Dimorphilus gyrociliatus]|uniref:DgyrCDS3593 n=1 Tax=Dimorphilus gyrociliatus TaxID=2664684 RepID=A0A7I8VGS3_9ANNE|nr:DgyrCDS3593 [Dimorphilus gyrociliatus]